MKKSRYYLNHDGRAVLDSELPLGKRSIYTGPKAHCKSFLSSARRAEREKAKSK